jgi:hypothetical protein
MLGDFLEPIEFPGKLKPPSSQIVYLVLTSDHQKDNFSFYLINCLGETISENVEGINFLNNGVR